MNNENCEHRRTYGEAACWTECVYCCVQHCHNRNAFSLTEAGTLAPIASPASSSESFENLYSAIASAGFDSSALAASKNGSALQVAKCIIAKMTGGTPCPE